VQTLEGLTKTHAAGIVHRDLKPANIFLTKADDGEIVKILDFGICKFQEREPGEETQTRPGIVIGTPVYMAPEHIREEAVDARSDLYSVGVLLYRCVCGHHPFVAESPGHLALAVLEAEPVPLETRIPDIDPAFSAIVRKAMSRRPEDRYQTSAEFREVLVEWLGRIDKLLAEFLDLRHVAARPEAVRLAATSAEAPPRPAGPTEEHTRDAPTLPRPAGALEETTMPRLQPRAPRDASSPFAPTVLADVEELPLPRLYTESELEPTKVKAPTPPVARLSAATETTELYATAVAPQPAPAVRPSISVAPPLRTRLLPALVLVFIAAALAIGLFAPLDRC
jgi:serine/threonine-protein kinase